MVVIREKVTGWWQLFSKADLCWLEGDQSAWDKSIWWTSEGSWTWFGVQNCLIYDLEQCNRNKKILKKHFTAPPSSACIVFFRSTNTFLCCSWVWISLQMVSKHVLKRKKILTSVLVISHHFSEQNAWQKQLNEWWARLQLPKALSIMLRSRESKAVRVRAARKQRREMLALRGLSPFPFLFLE